MAHIKYKINLKAALQNLVTDEVRVFANQSFWRHMDKYTPKDSGTLITDVHISADGIEYYSPYAHYLYNGKLMVSPTTGSSWAQKGETKVYASPEHPLQFQNGRMSDWGTVAMQNDGNDIKDEISKFIVERFNKR